MMPGPRRGCTPRHPSPFAAPGIGSVNPDPALPSHNRTPLTAITQTQRRGFGRGLCGLGNEVWYGLAGPALKAGWGGARAWGLRGPGGPDLLRGNTRDRRWSGRLTSPCDLGICHAHPDQHRDKPHDRSSRSLARRGFDRWCQAHASPGPSRSGRLTATSACVRPSSAPRGHDTLNGPTRRTGPHRRRRCPARCRPAWAFRHTRRPPGTRRPGRTPRAPQGAGTYARSASWRRSP